MTYTHYEQIAGLDEPRLRSLVREGTDAERVWAAWRLALLFGSDVDGTLTGALTEEASAGVRAHWVIVLFSHGEREVVAVLAQHDPSPLVRETAARYLAPTVGRSECFALAPAMAACLTDVAPRVRQITVRHLAAEPGPELTARVEGMVHDPDPQVRMAVLEYLLAHRPPSVRLLGPCAEDADVHVRRCAVEALTTRAPELQWALERVAIETDEVARDALTRWLLDEGHEAVLFEHLATRAPLMLHDVLAPVARDGRRFAWPLIAPAFGACPDSPTLLVLSGCLDAETIPSGPAGAIIEEVTAYYLGEELWLPHLIQITGPLLRTLPVDARQQFTELHGLLQGELTAARAQRWGPIETLEELLELWSAD